MCMHAHAHAHAQERGAVQGEYFQLQLPFFLKLVFPLTTQKANKDEQTEETRVNY